MNNEIIFNNPRLKERRRELRKNMTNAGVILWYELKGKKLNGYKFRRQHSIGDYIADFYCPMLKLAIEVDGATHSTTDEVDYDTERQAELENFGISFLRFRNEEVYQDKLNVIERIKIKIGELEKLTSASPCHLWEFLEHHIKSNC